MKSSLLVLALISASILAASSTTASATCKCTVVSITGPSSYMMKYNIDYCTNLSDPSCKISTYNPGHGISKECNGTLYAGHNNLVCGIAKVGGNATFSVIGLNHHHHLHNMQAGGMTQVKCTGSSEFSASCSNTFIPN
jgi:hypothetical protein